MPSEIAEARVILDLLHEGRGLAEFADTPHDGAGLEVPIDFLLDAHGVARLDAGLDELAVTFWCIYF
jgi:hypothetical protein